jgi:hypothetical protein
MSRWESSPLRSKSSNATGLKRPTRTATPNMLDKYGAKDTDLMGRNADYMARMMGATTCLPLSLRKLPYYER